MEAYIATNETDDSGAGEGKKYLAGTVAGSGGSFVITIPSGALIAGQYVTAVETRHNTDPTYGPNGSSDYARNVVVAAAAR